MMFRVRLGFIIFFISLIIGFICLVIINLNNFDNNVYSLRYIMVYGLGVIISICCLIYQIYLLYQD